MPIYEFYCRDCHAVMSFRSRRIDTESRPACPRCGREKLERRVSRFAVSRGRAEDKGEAPDPMAGVDEERLERAMESLASEMEHVDENDPRQAAQLMRRLYQATGLPLGPGMEEAIRRMEAGEDPDRIEQDLGDLLESEDPLGAATDEPGDRLARLRRRMLPPTVDETLYEM